jgi:hypothetical protein
LVSANEFLAAFQIQQGFASGSESPSPGVIHLRGTI